MKYVEIDGAPTDNNATLFKQGYDSVLSRPPGWTKVAEQDGNWDAPTAGRQFSAMLGKTPDIKAVWSPTTRWRAPWSTTSSVRA